MVWHGMSQFSALSITKLKSKCRPIMLVSRISEEKSSTFILAAGRIWFLGAVVLRFLFAFWRSAGGQSQHLKATIFLNAWLASSLGQKWDIKYFSCFKSLTSFSYQPEKIVYCLKAYVIWSAYLENLPILRSTVPIITWPIHMVKSIRITIQEMMQDVYTRKWEILGNILEFCLLSHACKTLRKFTIHINVYQIFDTIL